MILTCDHGGHGEPGAIDIGRIAYDRIIESGDLRATLEDLHLSKSGRAVRDYSPEPQDQTELYVRCTCGQALRAHWSPWLGFWLKVQDAGLDRLDLAVAKRQYQAVARSLDLGPKIDALHRKNLS